VKTERVGGPWTPAIFLLGGETRGTEPTAVLLRSGVRPATPPNVLEQALCHIQRWVGTLLRSVSA